MKLHLAIVPILVVAAVVLFPRATPRVIPNGPSGSGTPASATSVSLGAPLRGEPITESAPWENGEEWGFGPRVSGAPHPSSKLGDWSCSDPPNCGETPKPPQKRIIPSSGGVSGTATWWYSFGPGIYAAIRPDLGSKGDLVIVCGGKPFHCVTAPVITSCACLGPNSNRLVDLSKDLFASFADPSLGVVKVVLQVVGR